MFAMDERSKQQQDADLAVCKMNLDLWIHQNNLMWSRIQSLSLSQAGFFALASFVKSNRNLSMTICVVAVASVIALALNMIGDKLIRDQHRKSIERLGFDVFPGTLVRKNLANDPGVMVWEPIYYGVIFTIFLIADILGAIYFHRGAFG